MRSLRTYPQYWRHSPHGGPLGLCRSSATRPLLLAADRWPAWLLTYLAAPLLAIFAAVSGQCCRSRRLGVDDARLLADPAFLSRVAALGRRFALDRCGLFGVHARFGVPALAGQGRNVEGTQSGACRRSDDDYAPSIDASKTEHDENFPVASLLIAPRLRAPILSFYRFARAADDIADHPDALRKRASSHGSTPWRQTLLGKSDSAKAALPLRRVLAESGLAPDPSARSPHRLPRRRHQASLRELGRAHALLPLFGHAGRPLRARSAWRGPLDLGLFRSALRRPCR